MKLLPKLSLKASGLAAIATLTSGAAHAAATAAGDKYDGLVEVQDTILGIINTGGAFTIIAVSVIVAAVTFMVRREYSSLVIPVALGIFLSIGLNFATGLGGYTAETDQFVVSETNTFDAAS